MFIRTKTTPYNKTKVQIVRSVREDGKVRQKMVRHVGTAGSDEELCQLRVLGQTIIERLRQTASPQQSLLTPKQHAELYEHSREALLAARKAKKPERFGVDLAECREISRVGAGIREAMSEMVRQMGWERLLGARRMSGNRILKELILARLAEPLSKRATVRKLKEHEDVPLNLDRVYRTMDYLDDPLIDKIREQSLEAARKLYDESISVVFYDTTTLWFASEREDDEEPQDKREVGIRYKGYSKDGKPHRVQVMLALLVNADGIPMGYELFPGNTVEVTTLVSAIEQLQKNHPGVCFTLVADAGMISKDNEALLRGRDIPYVLGARLKVQKAAVKEWILDPDGFLPWETDSSTRKPKSKRYKVRTVDEAQLIVTHCDRRARKDARSREKQVTKLKKKLEKSGTPASLNPSGHARFLSFPEGRVELNEDKIAEAARWDGLHGIKAWGLDDQDPQSLIKQYHLRWEIEACFRTNKHDLKIRPIFHWKPRRIRAHIAICYMAFCCLQHLRHRLKLLGYPMSPNEIRRALNGLQFSILVQQGTHKQFAMPSRSMAEANRIYRCLGLKWNEAPFPVPVKSPKKSKPKSKPKSKSPS